MLIAVAFENEPAAALQLYVSWALGSSSDACALTRTCDPTRAVAGPAVAVTVGQSSPVTVTWTEPSVTVAYDASGWGVVMGGGLLWHAPTVSSQASNQAHATPRRTPNPPPRNELVLDVPFIGATPLFKTRDCIPGWEGR